jgi:predicted NBD/HSP70 family sugar kinase
MLYAMTGEVGVGGGLVIGGRLHLGSAGYALEIGHTPVHRGSRPCRCGNDGCLEVEADPIALLDAAGHATTEPTLDAARAVIERRRVDPAARAAVDLVIGRLASGLACMINILNPDRVVLGGMFAELLAADENRLRSGISRHSFLDQAARIELRAAELEASALTGAAELALQPLLDDPRLLAHQAPA